MHQAHARGSGEGHFGPVSRHRLGVGFESMAVEAGEHALDLIQDAVVETKNVQKILRDDGSKMINSFEVIKNLGKGAFGKVKLCRDTKQEEGGLYAIKIMDKNVRLTITFG